MTDRGDQAAFHRVVLQRVDRFVQIEFAGLPEDCPRLGACLEDLPRRRRLHLRRLDGLLRKRLS